MRNNWIISNLTAALDFFNSMLQNLYDLLTINPVTHQGGAVWDVVNGIYDALLGSSISLLFIFFYIGLLQESSDFIKHRKGGPIIWGFVLFTFMSGFLIYGRYILILIFSIGKEFVDSIALENGMNVFTNAAWAVLPDSVANATNGLSGTSAILLWIVTFFAAVLIMASCFVILMVIYGRLFKIYLHIAIAPLLLACAGGKATMHHFQSFLRSFIGVVLEGVAIIIACLIFGAFANNFEMENPIGVTTPNISTMTEEEIITYAEENNISIEEAITKLTDASLTETQNIVSQTDEAKAQNAAMVWKYLGQMLIMFLLMAGTIKGADETIRRMMGV